MNGTILVNAKLTTAYFKYARFSYTNVCGADFKDACCLEDAIIEDTDFSQAKNVPFIPQVCPDTGSFVGWKKALEIHLYSQVLVKIEVPEDAKRSSACGRKCRSNKVKILEITSLDGRKQYTEARSIYDSFFTYCVGDTIVVDDFDENRWNECAPGIHFFVNRQEAINY